MSMFSDGFATGFMGNMAQDIKKKKDEADMFFQEQMQLARTRGLKNRDLTKQVIDGHVMTARQLEQMGVPKDLVMSIAKQNPDDMPAVMETIQNLQRDGVKPDESFYRDLIKTSGDFKAPDEDFSTFISNLYAPLRANIKSDTEAFNDDPAGGLWATMMGTNAMGMANQRLEDTILTDGMSAADLLRYSDTPTPNTVGAPVVNIDYGIVGESERAAEEALSGSDILRIPEVVAVMGAYEKAFEEAQIEIQDEWSLQHPDDNETRFENIPGGEFTARRKAVEKIHGMFGDDIFKIPEIRGIIEESLGEGEGDHSTSDGTDTGATENVAPPMSIEGTSSVPETGLEGSVEGDVIPTPAGFPTSLQNGAILISVHSDGTSDWQYPDGTVKTHDNEQVTASQAKTLSPQETKEIQDLSRIPQ